MVSKRQVVGHQRKEADEKTPRITVSAARGTDEIATAMMGNGSVGTGLAGQEKWTIQLHLC